MVRTINVKESILAHADPEAQTKGFIFDIQRYSINDGPGIRTTVFFKGCPLTCLWCANPESQSPHPQLFYFDSLCTKCYRCVAACPSGVTTIDESGLIRIDRSRCKACGECVKACLSEARAISGRLMSVEELINIVKQDSLFYRNSGGGVTASGGEPTYQPVFLKKFFEGCHQRGFHTALDTCGYVQWKILETILEDTDLVLFDIKHMDPVRHRQLAGVDNGLILQNLRNLAYKRIPTIVRVPLTPGYNDSEEDLDLLANFLLHLSMLRVDILPYHRLGVSKYRRIGEEYKLNDVKLYSEEEIEMIKQTFQEKGFEVAIV